MPVLFTPAGRAILGGRPSWLPRADGIPATNFADYRPEGSVNRYWNNGLILPNAAAWWASRGSGSTFARASSAFGVPATGLLISYGTNVARRPVVDPANLSRGLGMQYEGARTNVMLQSNTLSNASWNKDHTSLGGTTTGPDGAASLTKVIPTAVAYAFQSVYQGSGDAISKARSISFYAKSGGYNFAAAGFGAAAVTDGAFFNLSNGTLGTVTAGATATITSVGNGIYLCTVSRTTAGQYAQLEIHSADNQGSWTPNGTDGIYLGFAQLELSAAFPSSCIGPTTTGSVTRTADSQSNTRPSAVTTLGKLLAGRTAISAAGSDKMIWSVSDGTASNYVAAYYNTSGHIAVEMNKATVKTTLDMGAVATNTDFVLAFNASSGNLSASLNGGAVVSDLTGGALPTGLTTEGEGQLNSGSLPAFMTLKGSGEWAALSDGAKISLAGDAAYWN